MHDHIILDAADAIEIAEALEDLMERLDLLTEHRPADALFVHCSSYGLEELRADVGRLIERLLTSPYLSQGTP